MPDSAPVETRFNDRVHVLLPDLTAYSLVYSDGDAASPRTVSLDEAATILAAYDIIFLGERHRHIGNHLAQMQLFRALHERIPELSLSMEQFERDVQETVNDYLAGRIGESPFIRAARAWGNYRTSYRPVVEYAKEHSLPVIAANAPGELVRCVGIKGESFLERMNPEQKLLVAETFDLSAGAYRDKFLDFVQGSPSHGGESDGADGGDPTAPSDRALKTYAAQVTRDETMAESIVRHLEMNPGRKIVHLNGSFHSDAFLGTVERVKARVPNAKIAVVSPLTVQENESFSLGADDLAAGTFILLLRAFPDAYASEEEMNAAMPKRTGVREERVCEL